MGRLTRIDYDGACHHIIMKAIDSQFMFKASRIKKTFIDLLIKYKEKHNIHLFAYCILDNHIHLFVQTSYLTKEEKELAKLNYHKQGHPRISEFMRDLLSTFARAYNRYKKRTGPVFNSRFKSFVCESTPYYIYLINYIHNNPKACTLTTTHNYKFSSYKDYFKSGGICDLDKCAEHIGMQLDDLKQLLSKHMQAEGLPYLEDILVKLRDKQNNQTVQDILISLAFKIEDFRGTSIHAYFMALRKSIIKVLIDVRKMRLGKIAKLFDISIGHVSSMLNSS